MENDKQLNLSCAFYKIFHLPSNSLNLHSALTWSAISAIIGKYINHTNDDAPK